MAKTPQPDDAALLSTGIVASILGLRQDAIRGMIELGTLPEPQWMSLGRRVERVYTQEWLLLALDRERHERLEHFVQLSSPLVPRDSVQFALRFPSESWTVEEIARTLVATESLWGLCQEVLNLEASAAPALQVRRMSAGSPLDVLVTVANTPVPGFGLAGIAAASLFVYVVRNAEKIGGALPSIVASWREQRARALNAKVDLAIAEDRVAEFERESAARFAAMKVAPEATELAERDERAARALLKSKGKSLESLQKRRDARRQNEIEGVEAD
ncbi:hypothetical protein [Agrococcus jejuensis]|uniref:Uncharacterized protein n=1 Tax=Agrococcus jejuensis TaxID=399736 RepID=A0A1G8B8Y8_9MICO|nr:hypothetical protein [Agrococcus jejuensis]SDH29709.1 hypothetical protein SAMN04489720_0754 [Agrococcus jejuensis]